MESALSPNTTALFNYLSSSFNNDQSNNPTSLPTAALFNSMPVPARDTPEDTPPSAPSSSEPLRHASADEESDSTLDRQNSTGLSTGANVRNKRKAGQHSRVAEEDEEEGSESDLPSGHEDKRQNGKGRTASGASGSGRRGGRKSLTTADGEGRKELSKSERRKEQNRAAQKAFRERREAKVKDLEDKVSELEGQAYGAQIENENLRGILKRLQEENVALKQSAFTFSMPMSTPASTNAPQPQNPKPPTPPHTNTEDSLKSVNDMRPASHRNSSAASLFKDSPESLVSVGSGTDQTPPNLFPDHFNAFALGGVGVPPKDPSVPTLAAQHQTEKKVSPPSSVSTAGDSEFAALWSSLYPNGVEPAVNQNSSDAKGGPFQLLNSQPEFMSFTNAGFGFSDYFPDSASAMETDPTPPPAPAAPTPNLGATGNTSDWNKFAFRDSSADAAAANWESGVDSSVSDFLASLTGSDNAAPQEPVGDDDAFNAQMRKIFGADNSPSAAFNIGTGSSTFSPNNYLNMSPSPLIQNSNGVSPESSASRSNTDSGNSPLSSNTSVSGAQKPSSGSESGDCLPANLGTCIAPGPFKKSHDIVHIIDENGRTVKPSELWIKLGMEYENSMDSLLIDDLCAQMRSKATCKDGKMQLSLKDAEEQYRHDWIKNQEAGNEPTP
ncbi:hypothetical protein L198_00601 [Cryptococcus wingfieldii CBS 7118]|uniref:BZIP domain-containing protein n=1 Tax=Cryptococcus wingfieldii CBS 7118 TaxID=1295528 RepID=A0A1E3K7G6_9TREE|nr:hypothetical protein L198_00601 [Cryptococcus wingfieldii CBS 7118]ODO08866.1 hypothetical protein L198_00601 [Cryptococcus wingfieldii CBS 7118]